MSDSQTEVILSAAIEVHRILGPGLLEAIYEDALCVEFGERQVPHQRQWRAPVYYKGHLLREQWIDLIAFGEVLIEIKAQARHEALFLAQTLSYLRCTGLRRGLVINFGLPTLIQGVQRVAL